MRKAEKRQAEDFLELLAQVHDQIIKAIAKNNIDVAQNLLVDCQEGAIALGNLLERTEKKLTVDENTDAISALEEYCEQIYQIHKKLDNYKDIPKALNGGMDFRGNFGEKIAVLEKNWSKRLRQLYILIKNSVGRIKVQREVVFLPYKASMWDSLESVWRAADEDPDCDAYVIPIPYFERNPDGSFRKGHYEGGQYPEYVPVVWYEDYDFESRQPDMIFIHNPYDDANYVTSVHPFFYSGNLKRFTQQLVYIPYFILGETDPKNKQVVENMKHFCILPGVINADRVIVQSEKMRQVYINVMTETLEEQGMGRKYWEKRILGFGSPKIDKVMSTRLEDLKVPEEWGRIIQKQDGNRKTVIFYNTSVGTLLKHGQKMLEKMRIVFRIFKENQDEIALLWRPHPLIRATIESMRPQLWAGYWEIVEQYREEGWGIYDDTADIDRAILISDAYYGSYSSVVQMCVEAGKKILIESIELREAT